MDFLDGSRIVVNGFSSQFLRFMVWPLMFVGDAPVAVREIGNSLQLLV